MRASTDSGGAQGNGDSYWPAISADGRYVAFGSYSSNLVPGDSNGQWDVFIKDARTGIATRVSTDSAGAQGAGDSYWPAISADGRFVAFGSYASNLVARDTNYLRDVFLKDTSTGETTRVSTDSAGTQGNGQNFLPAISADGRFVAFGSNASNLVPGDTNGTWDVLVKEIQTGKVIRASTDSAGREANSWSYHPSLSSDGRFVAFGSNASNLVAGDTNDTWDVFLKDTANGRITRVSTNSAGRQGNGESWWPSVSADGRYAAFASNAALVIGDTNDTWDIFINDTKTGQTTRVSTNLSGQQGNSWSYRPNISANGRYVAFESASSNLVPNDTNWKPDIFVKDTLSGQINSFSTGSASAQANGDSYWPAISADGRHIAFESIASNLVSGDNNDKYDIFFMDVCFGGAKCGISLKLR